MMQSFPHWVLKSYKQLILFYYREKSRARKKCGRNRSDSEKALLRASMIRDFSGISHGSESLQKKSHFLTLQDTLEELQMQAESRSGTFPQIRFENISKLPILIADSNTETAFVTLLHAAYNQIEHNNSENKKLSELRNSLLPQLMSGKIDVSRIRL